MTYEHYHAARFTYDAKRAAVWRCLVDEIFQKHVPDGHGSVLELGAGYCDFINAIRADKKYAVDLWQGFREYAAPEVETIVGTASDLGPIPDDSVNVAFASNLFEHLTQDELADCLQRLKRKLCSGGRLVIVQPNFKYAYRGYFDDYTHRTIWTDVSLVDFLKANGFNIMEVHGKFLPLSMKSRLPTWPLLIKLYLRSPIKPMAGQMMIVAESKI